MYLQEAGIQGNVLSGSFLLICAKFSGFQMFFFSLKFC